MHAGDRRETESVFLLQEFCLLEWKNRNWKETSLMEYGVVAAVVFVIAIGIYAGRGNRRKG